MKKISILLSAGLLLGLLSGCAPREDARIAATTLPVYEFTSRICEGTGLEVARLVTESVSCLHDYTLQVSQMRILEGAQVTVQNGAGLEEFLEDALESADIVIDASEGIEVLCPEEEHDHDHDHDHIEHDHHHEQDGHIWLSPANAMVMAQNICNGLSAHFPAHRDAFKKNLTGLLADLEQLQSYGEAQLAQLKCRELITFHDGFAYFAEAFDLTILRAVEEESGSEASAAELIELIGMVDEHGLPAIFTETNGADAAAKTIAVETGCAIFTLDMAMAGDSYFEAMYHNIDTIKEALG